MPLHASPSALGFLTGWQPQVGSQFYVAAQGPKSECPSGQGGNCNVSFGLVSEFTKCHF